MALEWPLNDEMWIEWGRNEREKNVGHLPCFKNSGHSTLIPVILNHSRMRKSSFQHHFNHSEVIQYQNDHRMRKESFQNDYKWQGWRGMEGFKIFSIKDIRHSILIPVIPPPFHHSSVIPLILSLKSIPPRFECFGWWNDPRVMGWHQNDWMTEEWSWNDWMTLEWADGIGMTSEWWNVDWMRTEWERKNLGHLLDSKIGIIPPSFQSF